MIQVRHVACAALALVALSASASGIVSTRAALDALLGAGATNENFEGYVLADGTFVDIGASLNSASTPNGQGPGLIAAGVTLSASNLVWQGNNFFSIPTKTMGANPGADISIDFTAFVTAAGLDLLNYGGFSTTYTVTVFDLDDTTVLQTVGGINFPAALTPTFFGFENAGGIGGLRVVATNGPGPVVDNLSFGTVPEPATITLTALSLLALGATRRRRG